MKALSLIALLIVGVCVGGAFAQDCCVFRLLRKDTTVGQGIFVIEPKPGQRARVTFEDIPVVVTTREDFVTSLGWINQTNTSDPFLNKTVSFSNVKDASLSLNFTGKKVEIVTATASHHGSMIVQVNQMPEEIISLYSSTRKDNVSVFSKDVPFGQNSIKVKVVGNGYVVIDFIRITE